MYAELGWNCLESTYKELKHNPEKAQYSVGDSLESTYKELKL